MNCIAEKIRATRKAKGLTQEELAEQAKVNLRTIQRIENAESEPRDKTLVLICKVLEIEFEVLTQKKPDNKIKNKATLVINVFFFAALNLVLMGVIGFLTLSSNATINSMFGGFLVSIFLPFFIVSKTKKMSSTERLLKFGFGYVIYFSLVILKHGFAAGFATGFVTGLFPCLLISLGVLYFGHHFTKTECNTIA